MDVDRRVVGVCDASDDRESEPGTGHCSGGGCSVEAFEDVGEIFFFDAGAVVGHRYPAVGDGDAHRGVGGTPFERVVDQVADGMVDRGGSDVYQAGVQLGVDGRLWHVLPQAVYRVVGEQVGRTVPWCGADS